LFHREEVALLLQPKTVLTSSTLAVEGRYAANLAPPAMACEGSEDC
jgi:hypothetical protein